MVIDGQLQTTPLRDARAVDEYLLVAGAETHLEPQFTFHGFRYARITGLTQHQLRRVEAHVVGSDIRRTGHFVTSDTLLNRLHDNTVWSLRGNFVSLPTDCPQRDERLGWTADIQVFTPTATYLYDVEALLNSWLEDLYAGQTADGSVPVVIPDVYRRPSVATAGWGDAVVVVPWELYQSSGDVRILRRAFPHMVRWIDRIRRSAGPDLVWSGGHQYGDWLDPAAPPNNPAAAMTDRDLVATAYFQRSTSITAEVAGILGHNVNHRQLSTLAEEIRRVFQDTFVTRGGRVTSETQTAYALAICFSLLDDDQVHAAGERLADLVRRSGHTIGTGFLGTPLVLDALTSTGHDQVALRLLRQTDCPSWLYPVTQGATTMWERWDSLMPDGQLNPGEMTSFNHYAFGAVADWMHRYLGGLTRLSPGWTRFRVTPPADSGLDFAETRLDSATGLIACRWEQNDDHLKLDLQVPEGATAETVMPDGSTTLLGPGHHQLTAHAGANTNGRTYARAGIHTTRDAIDAPELWARVVRAVQDFRPQWSQADIAAAAWPYFDHPLPDLARCVGLSIPTDDEDDLRTRLESLVNKSRS